ncbi:MAG: DNA-directed RNA polymerase subunit alpha [Candidatus Zambryskibacteria bacterium]|nr:DNA-directed RNA polymerase subunit alpha [Candidatus Zambryskibacteria bacterium]
MSDYTIVLPSKPRIVSEEKFSGVYEIDGLYPGYGHTLGNSLRRIILSSLPGAAITSVKIVGAPHEFSVLEGVKEDVINILLNLKQVRMLVTSSEPQTVTLKVKGVKDVTAGDIKVSGQVEVLNPELPIATLTDKSSELDIEITVEKGLGFVTKDLREKNRVDIGAIALDAIFTPIRRVSYEVENMRIGDRTDFNRLRLAISTDGTITPKDALEKSIEIMITQLKAVVGFKEEEELPVPKSVAFDQAQTTEAKEEDEDFLKTRIENLDLSVRTLNALSNANIRTVGGLARKKEADILEIEGMGAKGVSEIKKALADHGITLK